MPTEKPVGAWVCLNPSGMHLAVRFNGLSEASTWRKLMHEFKGKGRTQLEEMGYKVEWKDGAACHDTA